MAMTKPTCAIPGCTRPATGLQPLCSLHYGRQRHGRPMLGPSRRGFAALDAEARSAVSRKGGQAVPGGKRSFAVDRELAVSAGRKGGVKSHGDGRVRG